jgi:2-methylcitrate dehydratase PrpD
MMRSPTEILASYVSDGKVEDLPADVVSHAKHCIMDVISSGLGGRKTPDVDLLIDMMKEVGGKPEATVIGDRTKLSFMQAAQVNRLITNMLDYDDAYMKVGHMTTVFAPVALAMGEHLNSSGKAIISALVYAYEATVRIRNAVQPSTRESYVKSFERVDAGTPFGVTVVAGKLLGLTAEQMANAFGLTGFVRATRVTSPNRAKNGMPPWMKITCGDTTVPGMHSALLAKRGFPGDRQLLDQGGGYQRFLGSDQYDATKLIANFGKEYGTLKIGLKFYPACRYTSSALDAAAALVSENEIKADDIDHVVVKGQRHLYDHFRIYEPTYMIQAQFSIPYVVTMVLTGQPRTSWYTQETLKNPDLRAYQHKVKVEEDPAATEKFYSLYTAGATVEITLKGGKQVSKHIEYPKGEPENSFTEQDHIDKLTWMASSLGMSQGHIDKLYQTLNKLEDLEDISALTQLLVP